MITGYASSNVTYTNELTRKPTEPLIKTGTWADGISVPCEDAMVSNNHVIDATDVGILLFNRWDGVGRVVQRSKVLDNIILNAGNNAFAALSVDPLLKEGGCPTNVNPSFADSYIGRNVFWTGPMATFRIGLAVGTRPWTSVAEGCNGTGANVSNNSSNGFNVNVYHGIAVQGMLNATVQSNSFPTTLVSGGRCTPPPTFMSAGVNAELASGLLQQPYDNVAVMACIFD